MKPRSCVSPEGKFVYGIHEPGFTVDNLRENDYIGPLGESDDGTPVDNRINFPPGAVESGRAGIVYEVPNAFSFRGTTYINKVWADENAANPDGIGLPEPPPVSFASAVRRWFGEADPLDEHVDRLLRSLPDPLLFALAETGTEPGELARLAEMACAFVHDDATGRPAGLHYQKTDDGRIRPVIYKPLLFELLANNPDLPDDYKEAMVLRPGVQGGSEIVGEYRDLDDRTHVFEYLRTNSYIPWGHYAANMAHDAIRYRIRDLTLDDVRGMRHLYYQRTYIRLAGDLGLPVDAGRRTLSAEELEEIRKDISRQLDFESKRKSLSFNRTLWGWNFGFDYAPSRYRLHASHQQVHQQFAMIPQTVAAAGGPAEMAAYGCGDLVEEFIRQYYDTTGVRFFDAYIRAIDSNERMAGAPDGQHSLIVYSDDRVMVFVPKAQTSQWELQLMTRVPVGNIVEADRRTRRSLDYAMLAAVKALSGLGAKMITTIEFAKRIDNPDGDQRLIYSFLPRLPESPGAFSEAQLRWINGHYPEDFATACRRALSENG
ncbi:MAG: hypothetical protein ACQERN_12590 [Thermodesulfobacteriota bacterium]